MKTRKKILTALFVGLIITPSLSWSFLNSFGNDGFSGQNGQEGYKGEKGRDITLRADGQNQFLDLSGQNGRDGGHGGLGENAKWCNQPTPDHNIEGALGGDGGKGGNGGDGGDGGNATIYYTNPNDLEGIVINSTPGQGGLGGFGADGGYGCECETYEWSKFVTETDKKWVTKNVCDENNNCTEKRELVPFKRDVRKNYSCEDGQMGSRGQDGANGYRGLIGKVKLIQKSSPLEKEYPKANEKLSKLTRETVLLSRHLWETRSGILSLIGAGSQVDNYYSEWTGLYEKSFSIIWNVPSKSINSYKNVNVSLNLESDKNIKVKFPYNFWPRFITKNDREHKTIEIYNAIFKSEAEKIKPTSLIVEGKKTHLIVKDNGPQIDELNTRFYISAAWSRTDGGGRGLLKRYKDYVPSHLIEKRGGQFKINIGKLPIKNKYFKKRWLVGHYPVKFNLTIERKFGVYSTKIGTFKIKKKAKKSASIKKEKLEI